MNEQTFEVSVGKKQKKEASEWIRIWCEDTESPLPRVALIGDSITEQVFEGVKKALDGVANVDVLATSYSITSPAYFAMVKAFVEDSDYAVVYFNYGLHASSVSIADYEGAYREMLGLFLKKSKVLIGTSTDVQTYRSDIINPCVCERNVCARRLAKEFGLQVDNAYEISVEMGENGKCEDGVHFNEKGVKRLAEHKAERLKTLLQ